MIIERDAEAGTTTIVLPSGVCAAPEMTHGVKVKVQVKNGHLYVIGNLELIAETMIPLDVLRAAEHVDRAAGMVAKLFAERWGEELVAETINCFMPEIEQKTREAVTQKGELLVG